MSDFCIVHQVEDCPACMQAEIELLRDGAKRAVDDAYALAEENRRLTALVEEATAWHTMDQLPDVGRKFICLHNDGSGAIMFWRHDGGYIDQDGDDCLLEPAYYDRWAYLPDELEFWCETRSEDPMTLTLPSTTLSSGSDNA